jgi:hypothetical protein
MDWYQFKLALTEATGISQDALHILAGIGIQLVVAKVTGRSVARPLPWLIVLALTLINEWSDLGLETWPDRDRQWLESVKDLIVTMALPTLLLVTARWSPAILIGRANPELVSAAHRNPPRDP